MRREWTWNFIFWMLNVQCSVFHKMSDVDPSRSGVKNLLLLFWRKINECLRLSLFGSNCFVTLSNLISTDNHFPELFRNIFWSWKDSFMSHAIRSHRLHPQQRQLMSDQHVKCIYKENVFSVIFYVVWFSFLRYDYIKNRAQLH